MNVNNYNGMKIVFWGEDAFSNVVLQSLISANHNVQLVITPLYDNLRYKKLEYTCNANNIPLDRYKNINAKEVVEKVKSLDPDICVVAHFERLIKKDLLSIPKLGFINLHPSLLPNYRGMSPQHWPIINGDIETGITVHYIDEGTDTGDIILQRKLVLNNNMYVSDLQKEWLNQYKTIIVEAIDCILSGAPVWQQRHCRGSYYGRLKPEQCKIEISQGIEAAYNLIRGVSMPYIGASFENFIIYRASIITKEKQSENVGKLIANGNGGYFLVFVDGVLKIEKYKTV